MEIAGLVLGVVGVMPVIVEVVKSYRSMIVGLAHVKRYMAELAQDLKTEELILHNIYELLLDGIVPAWELETLTRMEPQNPKWQEYDRQIRARLGKSFIIFLKGAQDIHQAVEELQQNLATDAKGNVSLRQTLDPKYLSHDNQ